jgi:archaemetzincin
VEIPQPRAGDWLALNEEPGQTFAQFKRERVNRPRLNRRKLVVVPLDELIGPEMPDLQVVCDYAAAFFQLPVERKPVVQLAALRPRSRSRGTYRQFYTRDILAALRRRLPGDAYCMIAVTTSDLYQAPERNYVFGEATFRERVGVYSFARYDPAWNGQPRGPGAAMTILHRGLKVVAHEIGHMCGLRHCVHYHCMMNGSNDLIESDAAPLHLCPVCRRKLHHAVGYDPAQRERDLAGFYRAHGFLVDAARCERRLSAILAASGA